MPFANFFRERGLLVIDDFLSAEDCQRVGADLEHAGTFQGGVWRPEDGDQLRPEVKSRTEYLGVSAGTAQIVFRALADLIPKASHHFGIDAFGFQPPKFTAYNVGDYYRVHQDVVRGIELPENIRERKISIIIFLDQEGDVPEEADYCGGNLTFYGLVGTPAWNGVGLPLESEQGMLVAFLPETPHEVTPVTYGLRRTITTWLV